SSFSVFIRARVSNNTIQPGCKLRVLIKLVDACEQFEEDLLSDIVSHRLVAAVMKRDRIDAIFVRLEQVMKRGPIAALAGVYCFKLGLAIAHCLSPLHTSCQP